MKRDFLNKNVDRQINGARHFGKRLVLLFLFLLCCVSIKSYSQNINPLISFSVESCSLDVALEKLFAEYELNVAFSKAELSKIRIEKYFCSYKSVEEVLSDLLKGTDYGFKRVGKQYVIRKNQLLEPTVKDEPVAQIEQNQEVVEHKFDTVINKAADTVRLFDTMHIIRTVMRYDTIVRVDRVVETDTVYKTVYKGLEIPWPKFKDNGWFIAPFVAYDLVHLDFESKVPMDGGMMEVTPSSAFALGLDGGYKYERLSVGMSLSYRSVKYRFMLEQTVLEGDYYENDTLDTYYVVHPVSGDTTYQYILDSIYVPLETTHYSYRDLNRLDYLSVGLFASFDFWKREHFRMFIKAGASADFLVGFGGSYNNMEAPFHAPIARDQVESIRFSYYGGIGAAVKVVNRLELVPEVTFRKTNGTLYCEGFPFDLGMHLWDFRLGLTYYF